VKVREKEEEDKEETGERENIAKCR